MRKNKIKKSAGDYIFTIINTICMVIFSIIMLYPLWYVVIASFEDFTTLMERGGELILWPSTFSLDAYKLTFMNNNIITGYGVTIYVTVMGTVLGVFFSALAGYFGSRKDVKLGKFIMLMMIFTMYFNGGLIPNYFNVKSFGMDNTLWALIIPGMISTYNSILMRSSFEALPRSLEESAEIDGAGHWTVLFKIVLPIAKATIAVIALYYAVAKWNEWFNGMIYIKDAAKRPLQLVLRDILMAGSMEGMTSAGGAEESAAMAERLKYSTIVVATLPILCVYPFIQKYFVKGVTIGAVKG